MNKSQESVSARPSWWQLIKSCSGTAQDRRNQYWFVAWLFAWAVSFVVATWMFEKNPGVASTMAWALATPPLIFSIGALIAYLRFLRMADEMLQQIQLKGLAIGFGAGAIASLGYPLLERVGAPAMEINDLVVVMMVGWGVGQLLALRSYR